MIPKKRTLKTCSKETNFENLLDFFFQIHDPTTLNRQGNDVGTSYRSAIFYQNDEQKAEAEKFIQRVNDSGRWDSPVVTTLEPFEAFWPAEPEHQDYLQNVPWGYTCHYMFLGVTLATTSGQAEVIC